MSNEHGTADLFHDTLFEEMIDEASDVQVRDGYMPFDPVQSGEHVLGELNEGLKRLWILRKEIDNTYERWTSTNYDALVKRELDDLDPDDEERLRKEESRHEARRMLADAAFFASLQATFPGYRHGELGVRSNWKVVLVPRPDPQAIAPFFDWTPGTDAVVAIPSV